MMKRIQKMLMVIMLMLMANATASAQTDLARLNEENARLQEQLQKLTARQKELSETARTLEAQCKSLDADIKKETKVLGKKQDKLNKSKALELHKKQEELEASNEELVKKVLEKEAKIYQLDQLLAMMANRIRNLERVRDDVGKDLIENHRQYVEQAFSTMKTEQLNAIKAECTQYATDNKVQQFAQQVDKVISWKQAYDNANKVVTQRFNPTEVEQALNALPSTGLNSVQQEEMNNVRTELQNYGKGLDTLKEFINAVNSKRTTIFSRTDLDDELGIILSKNNLKQRIASTVETVPYLKGKYNEYMKAIRANPGKPTKVEEEILAINP